MSRMNHVRTACKCLGASLFLGVSQVAAQQTCYRITDLTPGNAIPIGSNDVIGLNSAGEVAGTLLADCAGGCERHAFVWLPQAAHALPAGLTDLHVFLDLGSGESTAHDINDAGYVAGEVNGVAVVWKLGTPVQSFDLSTFGSAAAIDVPTVAFALNDADPPVATGDADGQWRCTCNPTDPTHPTTLGFRVVV